MQEIIKKLHKSMDIPPIGLTLPGITHYCADVNGTGLYYIAA